MNTKLIRSCIFGALGGIPLGYTASYYAQNGIFRLGRSLVDYLTQIHDILLHTGDFSSDDWTSACVTAWIGIVTGPILGGVIAIIVNKKKAAQ